MTKDEKIGLILKRMRDRLDNYDKDFSSDLAQFSTRLKEAAKLL